MLHHYVLINATEEATEEQIVAVIDGLRALPGQIDEIGTYEVGRDLGLADGNAVVAIHATFASPEALNAYIVHPAHQQVVTELIAPIKQSVSRAQVSG